MSNKLKFYTCIGLFTISIGCFIFFKSNREIFLTQIGIFASIVTAILYLISAFAYLSKILKEN